MSLLRIVLFLMFATATAAAAQTDIALGGIQADSSAPVEITADSLSVDQETGIAAFSGNVLITQGELRLSAGSVEVVYDDDSGDITRLIASGGVTFVTATDAAEAQTAVYDLADNTLNMTGDVLITQGRSAIAADSMRVNLATGKAQLDGRVRTTLTQQDNN
ncbi:lipopolysaccharide transport periplasmic protein LptA [Marivivens niveibacter]|uniref:Lipopolysaccharide transport periplasmic protein LptA n=1 Tax=Marivivens niveibacter TaxID=1930667 RepID=A0A251WZR9_9RHOB|nr:lipopolysaccharide transport periplasmic protein LptA [Marivivens niveibacter]OUD09635.1 lipopolysaccharide transport periplasmic protein LptA [Marivivens niveibacter]